METLIRWIAALPFTPLAVLTLQGLALNAQALTDTNAELKEVANDRAAHAVVVTARAAVPGQLAWVPATPKSLDGFKPALPPARSLGLAMARAHALSGTQAQAEAQTLAKADAPAGAGVRR